MVTSMTVETQPGQQEKAELVHYNNELVNEAYDKITMTFAEYYHKAIFEVGDYLVKIFFDGDFDRARTLKQKLSDKDKKALNDDQLIKEESFHQLTKKFYHGDMGTPSKTWLYNAVKLAVQDHEFKENGEYKLMNVSKKILLFPYEDRNKKLKLIAKISPKLVTVTEAKKLLPPSARSTRRGIPYYISNPDKLYSKSFLKKFGEDAMGEIDGKQKKELLKKTKGKKQKVEKLISQYQAMVANLEKLESELERE